LAGVDQKKESVDVRVQCYSLIGLIVTVRLPKVSVW